MMRCIVMMSNLNIIAKAITIISINIPTSNIKYCQRIRKSHPTSHPLHTHTPKAIFTATHMTIRTPSSFGKTGTNNQQASSATGPGVFGLRLLGRYNRGQVWQQGERETWPVVHWTICFVLISILDHYKGRAWIEERTWRWSTCCLNERHSMDMKPTKNYFI